MRGLGGLGLRVLGGFLRLEEEREHQKNLRCCLVLVLEETTFEAAVSTLLLTLLPIPPGFCFKSSRGIPGGSS